jgi:hypothetical protein
MIPSAQRRKDFKMSELAELMGRRSELQAAWMEWVDEQKAAGVGSGVRAVGPILGRNGELSLYVWVGEVRFGDLVARQGEPVKWVMG